MNFLRLLFCAAALSGCASEVVTAQLADEVRGKTDDGDCIDDCVTATVDADVKAKLEAMTHRLVRYEATRDETSPRYDIRIVTTTDGAVILAPGATTYFEIDPRDEYTASGGWYWTVGGTPERASLPGATLVLAERDARGVVTWTRVELVAVE